MANPPEPPESALLWRFSLAFYALPGVAEAMIALQDKKQLDVNLILFALWLGISGSGRLERDALAQADRVVCAIRHRLVEPLRALRRALKRDADEGVRQLRDGVKALELAGERLAQTRLERLARSPSHGLPASSRLADAAANLALYLGPETILGAEAVVIRQALETFVRAADDGDRPAGTTIFPARRPL